MNVIAAYKQDAKLTIDQLAEKLGKSRGHTCDLVNGKYELSIDLAKKIGELTGRPWHEIMDEAATAGRAA